MHPELFYLHVGTHAHVVHAYSFFYFVAVAIVVGGSWWRLHKNHFSHQHIAILMSAIVIGGFGGARLMHFATNYSAYVQSDAHLFELSMYNFALTGGVFGAVISGYCIGKLIKLDLWAFADQVAIFLGLGIACARIGCFLNGCCFGVTTSFITGVQFPLMSQAHLYQIAHGTGALFSAHLVHPTQLYELSAAIFGSLLAWMILRRDYPSGTAILLFGAWLAFFRLINMHLRAVPDNFTAPLWLYPAIYSAIIFFCVYMLYKKSNI